MIVLGLLQNPTVRLMQDALSRSAQVLVSSNSSMFANMLRREAVDVAVVDPTAGGRFFIGVNPAAAALAGAPHVPFLLYLSRSTGSSADDRAFLQLGPSGLLLRGSDDTPSGIISAIRQAAESSLPNRVMHIIAQHMERLPHSMQVVLRRVFEEADVTEHVSDLCDSSGVPRRTFDRRLDEAGLESAWMMLAAGRVVSAYRQLRADGATCDEVARGMEYSSGRRLYQDVKAVLNTTPTEMRRLEVGEFARRVGEALVRGNEKSQQEVS